MPLADFKCNLCEHQFEALFRNGERVLCPKCTQPCVQKLLSAHGGYQMSSGGSSTRPKNAGAFKPKK